MEREQFTFYSSFARAVKRIRKAADRAAAYDAIIDYALYGEEPNLEKLPETAAIAFELVRPNLDASRRKAENGVKGGRPKAKGKQDETKAESAFSDGEEIKKQIESKEKANETKAEANDKQEQTANKKEKENEIENEVEIEGEKENECYISLPKERDKEKPLPLSPPEKQGQAPRRLSQRELDEILSLPSQEFDKRVKALPPEMMPAIINERYKRKFGGV